MSEMPERLKTKAALVAHSAGRRDLFEVVPQKRVWNQNRDEDERKQMFFFAKPVTPWGVCSGAEQSRASAASSSRPLTASTDEINAGCKARVERRKVSEGADEDDE